jgi:RNA polymerase sigma factor (sigma-70 family)
MAGARSSGAAAGPLGALFTLGAAGSLTDGQLLERFLTRDDPSASEAAFTALVDRHGPMVLGVCLRELDDVHDAHDAFQATFLVLVSKAAMIRRRGSLGGWLLGVARRVAAKSRQDYARRRRLIERLADEPTLLGDSPVGSMPAESEIDYAPLIDEVSRLPERYRAPVVLHYFEGLSAEATAQLLGCARGTVLSRLSRARDRLRRRLERRGMAPAILIPAVEAPTRWLLPMPVPAALAQGTIRAASSLGLAGAAIESVVPAAVARLSRRVTRTLALSRVGVAAAFLLIAAAGVTIGLAATLRPDSPPQRGVAMEKPRGTPEKQQAPRSDHPTKPRPLALRGQVLDPDGKPVAGAAIPLGVAGPGLYGEPRRLGASGPDGRFEVSVPRGDVEPPPGRPDSPFLASLAAESPPHGPDWWSIDVKKAGEPIRLKLRRDDVPVEGRIINLEGRPVPDLSVKLMYIAEFPPDLIDKLRANGGRMNPPLWFEMRNVFIPGTQGPDRSATTSVDGRFRLAGIGRDRVAMLRVEGGSIEQSFAMVLTSSDRGYKPVLLPADGPDERKLEGPRFVMFVAPGRVVEGTVRDRDTGKPIAGAKAQDWFGMHHTSDAKGRFRIAGQPQGRSDVPNFLIVTMDDQPYIKYSKPVDAPRGLASVHLDVALKRGVWVEGRVTDRATGRPVRAVVTYYPLRDNPHVEHYPGAAFLNNFMMDEAECPTDVSGRFRAAVIPGPGVLLVRAEGPGYLAARPPDEKILGNILLAPGVEFRPNYMKPYHALVPIEAPAGKTLALPDIALTAGRMQHIRMVDPDGKPVAGTKVLCLQSGSLAGQDVPGDELTFIHANPGKAESIIVWQDARSLGATVDLKGDEPDPFRLVLRPTGTVTSRLVDEDGKPRPEVDLAVMQQYMSRGDGNGSERLGPVVTGPDGRFRIETLVPGLTYDINVIKRGERDYSRRTEGYLHKTSWKLKPGEVQDWGDVQARPYRP